ncbi:MAG: DUF2442 domain-containing protein [Clostridiales Family XIII bacterium]|jgi:hypothetical protein|nr:DUF2442 domain-containing protein [Clostridiales Family XIII bacterium]
MYIKNGIAYADDLGMEIEVAAVKPLNDYKLLVTFSTNETKLYDFKPHLSHDVFRPLRDINLFMAAHVGFGTVVWDNDLDIAPERLYEDGESVNE